MFWWLQINILYMQYFFRKTKVIELKIYIKEFCVLSLNQVKWFDIHSFNICKANKHLFPHIGRECGEESS